jgi:hypothetical protein
VELDIELVEVVGLDIEKSEDDGGIEETNLFEVATTGTELGDSEVESPVFTGASSASIVVGAPDETHVNMTPKVAVGSVKYTVPQVPRGKLFRTRQFWCSLRQNRVARAVLPVGIGSSTKRTWGKISVEATACETLVTVMICAAKYHAHMVLGTVSDSAGDGVHYQED